MKSNKLVLNLILSFFAVVTIINAQQKEQDYILSKMAEYYETKDNYVYELNYKMYRGYTKDSLTENYTSRIIKNGLRLKMSFLEYDLYVFPQVQLTIAKKEKVIYVNDVTIDLNPANLSQTTMAMRQFCEVTNFERKGKYALITLVPKIEDLYPYNKIELKVNTKKYNVEEQNLFFVRKLAFEDMKGNRSLDNACLNISFKEEKNTLKNNLPDLNYFLKYSKNNKEITITSNFKNFEVIDQRKK